MLELTIYGRKIVRAVDSDRRTEPPRVSDVPRVTRWDDDRSLAAEEARLHQLNIVNAKFWGRKLKP